MAVPDRLATAREALGKRGLPVFTVEPAPQDVLPTGIPLLDGLLPGGFPRRAVSEVLGARSCGKTSLAVAALAAATRRGLAAFVDPAAEAYPPAFAGVLLPRLLFVRPGPEGALEAAEILLQSGAFQAVVLDLSAVDLHPRTVERRARILRAAAEANGPALIALGRGLGPAPAVRLHVTATAAPGRARVTVEKSRWGRVGETAIVPVTA